MTRLEQIAALNEMLLSEMPQYKKEAENFPREEAAQRRLLRSLMNVRPPMPLHAAYLKLQDILLSAEREEKGVIGIDEAQETGARGICLWQGDITRLAADAIVNAGNKALLGCFCPCHGCIDNAIHSAAGLQLREECSRIMQAQGHDEPAGKAKITGAYNLPASYVLHTVGPIVQGRLTSQDQEQLKSCYLSCLQLAAERDLKSIAFCCISTGEYRFPNQRAAEIAVAAVKGFLGRNGSGIKGIFNVFKDLDYKIYRDLLFAA